MNWLTDLSRERSYKIPTSSPFNRSAPDMHRGDISPTAINDIGNLEKYSRPKTDSEHRKPNCKLTPVVRNVIAPRLGSDNIIMVGYPYRCNIKFGPPNSANDGVVIGNLTKYGSKQIFF